VVKKLKMFGWLPCAIAQKLQILAELSPQAKGRSSLSFPPVLSHTVHRNPLQMHMVPLHTIAAQLQPDQVHT
jgi:hypothetical protein